MIEILKQGSKRSSIKFYFKCKICSCKFTAQDTDVILYFTDWFPGQYWAGINCPKCGKQVISYRSKKERK